MKRVRLFFEIAIKMLLVHKQRTALSILGVLSGIAMLISVNNISRSTMENTKELLEKFGPELIVVEPAKVRVVGKGKTDYVPTTKLNFRDVELMRNNLIDVKNIVPVVNMGANAVYLGKSTKTTISGATKDIFDMRKLSLKDGRLFTKKEAEVGSRKCILGNSVYEALFGNERAYGKNILISNVYFEVIGVLNEKGKDLADVDLDNAIYIPINTFKSRLADIESISAILVEANNPDDINGIKKSMVTLLKQNHKKAVLKEEAFNIFSLREVARAKTESINLVSLLSKMASVITFSIGGLGIFAIMLLSAYERQREIGIRMAVGATKRDILTQLCQHYVLKLIFS